MVCSRGTWRESSPEVFLREDISLRFVSEVFSPERILAEISV